MVSNFALHNLVKSSLKGHQQVPKHQGTTDLSLTENLEGMWWNRLTSAATVRC